MLNRAECCIKGRMCRTKECLEIKIMKAETTKWGDLENKVEKYLPERKVERKKDGIWEK